MSDIIKDEASSRVTEGVGAKPERTDEDRAQDQKSVEDKASQLIDEAAPSGGSKNDGDTPLAEGNRSAV